MHLQGVVEIFRLLGMEFQKSSVAIRGFLSSHKI